MDGLDDFMLFNAIEDDCEEQAHQTTEYPYQSQFWEDKEKKSSYWDDNSSPDNEY